MSALFDYYQSNFKGGAQDLINEFFDEIKRLANSASIDCTEKSKKIDLDGKLYKGSSVVGLTRADMSRVSVIAYDNEITLKCGNKIRCPFIRFKNDRISFGGEWIDWNGFDCLIDAYKRKREIDLARPKSFTEKPPVVPDSDLISQRTLAGIADYLS